MIEYNRNQAASVKKQAIEESLRQELQRVSLEQRQVCSNDLVFKIKLQKLEYFYPTIFVAYYKNN